MLTDWQRWSRKGERERERDRESRQRRGEERETKRICVFYRSNYGIGRAHKSRTTLRYIQLQRGHTQRSSCLIPSMTCPPSVSDFQFTKGTETLGEKSEKGHQGR